MFRSLLKAAVIGAGACAVLTACAPVKLGAAAIVGDQRISLAQLDNQVSALNNAAKSYKDQTQLTAAQAPGEVLSWLIRFAIRDQMAARAGISVSSAEVQDSTAELNEEVQEQAEQQGQSGVSLNLFLVDNGIPPGLIQDVGRYQAIELAYIESLYGGKLPTSTAAQNAGEAKFGDLECSTAKSLNIRVSPQFGQLNYSNFQVVATPNLLSRASDVAKTTSSIPSSC